MYRAFILWIKLSIGFSEQEMTKSKSAWLNQAVLLSEIQILVVGLINTGCLGSG
jgi:hypothetical protein